MAVQRPNSAGRGEGRQGGLDGTGALITGAGGIKGGGSAVCKTRTVIEAAKARAVRPWGGVSKVEIEGNNILYIKGIGVAISTFETLPGTVTRLWLRRDRFRPTVCPAFAPVA